MFSVIDIAEALSYNKIERLRAIEELKQEELHSIFRSSSRETLTIILFPWKLYEIRHDRLASYMFYSRAPNATQNYFISHPEINEKFLRKVFTGLELLLYKTCHIALENLDREYSFEREKTIVRFNKIRSVVNTQDWEYYKWIFLEIMAVRDYFAHSFVDINEIPYRGVPLAACFRRQSRRAQITSLHEEKSFTFIADLRTLFDPLTKAFQERQLEQLDKSKFFKLCDHIIKDRSLIV